MRKPKNFKKIDLSIKNYYCIELINGNYIVYDQDMRNPIEYGSLVIVEGLFSKLQDSYNVIYYKSSDLKGFEQTNRKKPTLNSKIELTKSNGKDVSVYWTVLDPKQNTFYYIELENNKVALFDSDMGNPITLGSNVKGYGQKSVVDVIVSSLPKDSTVFYFKQINKELRFRSKYCGEDVKK